MIIILVVGLIIGFVILYNRDPYSSVAVLCIHVIILTIRASFGSSLVIDVVMKSTTLETANIHYGEVTEHYGLAVIIIAILALTACINMLLKYQLEKTS